MSVFNQLNTKLHTHSWDTTHTNKWIHPTRQTCKCGLIREFEYYPKEMNLKGMPWKLGRWVWSNGEESKYSTAF